MKILLFVFLAFGLCSCLPSKEEKYDQAYDIGYDDGYAVGYNTECKIRATLINGDWDVLGYSNGYYAGEADGKTACRGSSDYRE